MLSRLAWEISASAFEASRSQKTTLALRRCLQQCGVAWFWAALAIDGRALEVWREYRAQQGLDADTAWEPMSEAPVLPAWSLPNNPRMRGLGLGRVWVVACPYCRRYHMHAPQEGSRPAQCHAMANRPELYVLHYEGELPRGLWERFCLNVTDEKPRLLRPPHRLEEDLLEAAA